MSNYTQITATGTVTSSPVAIRGLIWTGATTNGHTMVLRHLGSNAIIVTMTRRAGDHQTIVWSPPKVVEAPTGLAVSALGSGKVHLHT